MYGINEESFKTNKMTTKSSFKVPLGDEQFISEEEVILEINNHLVEKIKNIVTHSLSITGFQEVTELQYNAW